MNFAVPTRRIADDLAFLWHPGLLAALLRCDRLTIMHASAGTTRDAMLQQVLLPLLGRRSTDCQLGQVPLQPTVLPIVEQRHRRPGSRRDAELVLRFDAWGESPLTALRERIAHALPMAWPAGAPATLADHLREACRAHDIQLLLVLDAFERHLAQPLGRRAIARFDAQFIDWMQHSDVPAHALLLVDGAHEAQLQRYADALPDIGHGWLRASTAADSLEPSWTPVRDAASAPAVASVRPPLGTSAGTSAALPPKKSSPPPTQTSPPPPPAAPPVRPPAPAARAVPAVPEMAADLEIRAGPDDHVGGAPGASPAVLPATRPIVPVAAPAITAVRDAPVAANDNERPVQKAPLRWPRQVANAALVVAAAWMLGVWLLGQEETGVRTVAADGPREAATAPPVAAPAPAPPAPTPSAPATTVAPAPPVAASPAATPPVEAAPSATPAAPAMAPTASAAPSAAAAATPALAASWQLTITRPVEGGSAPWLIDELARRVAAPAGITLRYAAPGAAAPLAVWRHDALVAAREDARGPLRVLAPLYNEQIQVLVRADSRWRWLHQLQGLHLNVGAAGGARAITADTLYRRLYGRALPGWDTDHGDEATGLRRLLGDRSIDAMLVVAESPVLAAQPPAVRERLRLLQVDLQHRSTASVLRSYLGLRARQPNEPPVLAVTSFLVSPTAPSPGIEPALQVLVGALCRARPALQAQASPLLRGIDPRLQPTVGWPYLIPMRDGSTDCPAPPSAR